MALALERLLALLELDSGPPEPLPAIDGWELVLAENVAYLVDDDTRDQCMLALRREVGLDPEAILSAQPEQLRAVVAGVHPLDRVERLRRCAELRLAGAPWKSYPSIGRPGAERIELFSGERAVLALDSNATRVLFRLGYGERRSSYSTMYREIKAPPSASSPPKSPWCNEHTSCFDGTESRFAPGTSPPARCARCERSAPAGRGLRSVEDPFAKP